MGPLLGHKGSAGLVLLQDGPKAEQRGPPGYNGHSDAQELSGLPRPGQGGVSLLAHDRRGQDRDKRLGWRFLCRQQYGPCRGGYRGSGPHLLAICTTVAPLRRSHDYPPEALFKEGDPVGRSLCPGAGGGGQRLEGPSERV